MEIFQLDPLLDPRWPEFLEAHPGSSVFHTRGWLEALSKTYNYAPVVFTTSSSSSLENGVVFCEVRSWMTGKRLVSLPFSDHCEPLAIGNDLKSILHHVEQKRAVQGWKYLELRPLTQDVKGALEPDLQPGESFSVHSMDLTPEAAVIFKQFHDSCIRRKIRKAEREALTYEEGRSEELLQKFLHLMLLTRRRHKLPPQPATWFRSLMSGLGSQLTIHVASKNSQPVASILTIRHKTSLMYKYGCSDSAHHNLGGMPFLFWKAIQDAKQKGITTFDLGRSAPEDPGLIAFKGHLGATAAPLTYFRNPASKSTETPASIKNSWAREVLARLPDPLLAGAGELFYRHLG
jgi:hypothetical protein